MDIFDAARISPNRAEQIISEYTKPERRYHNWNHIQHMWVHFERLLAVVSGYEQEAMAAAIIYHDLYYNPRMNPGVNELNSAQLFYMDVGHRAFEPHMAWVPSAIIRTAHHPYMRVSTTLDHWSGLLLDPDLLGFAQPFEVVLRNTENIREEYGHVSEQDFWGRRLLFLGQFPYRIFYNDRIEEVYGGRTRINISSEIDWIKLNHGRIIGGRR